LSIADLIFLERLRLRWYEHILSQVARPILVGFPPVTGHWLRRIFFFIAVIIPKLLTRGVLY
jgi:hypothetical protein